MLARVLLCIVFFVVIGMPQRALAVPSDLPSLLFVTAAASEAAYSGELSEMLRARLVAAGALRAMRRRDDAGRWGGSSIW